jgi:GAF domain-containing protein
MRRRSKAGGEPAKTRRRKTVTPKRRNAPKVRGRGTPAPDQGTEIARFIRERDQALEQLSETLEQQAATAEVLRVISSSPGELEPVFQAMLENATRLCEAKFGVLFRPERDSLRAVAMHGAPLAYVEERRRNPIIRPNPKTTLGRAVASKQTVHTADVLKEPDYFDAPSGYTAAQLTKLGGARTVLAVPMIKDSELIGAIVIYRQEVRPFTEKQIALVHNFAAQAVIAIENTRLLNELRQRTTDLSESLEQQTATSEVLRVISSSPGALEPVFEIMLENATRICEAKYGNLYLFSDQTFQIVAAHSASVELASERLRGPPIYPAPGTGLGRVLTTKAAVQIADVLNDPGYPRDHPLRIAAERGGVRTLLAIPLLKDEELVGAITILRQEIRPFTDKQIALVTNFAAQAVIAIENTRLLNELRYWASSAARPANCSLCSTRCWRTRHASVKHHLATCCCVKAILSGG